MHDMFSEGPAGSHCGFSWLPGKKFMRENETKKVHSMKTHFAKTHYRQNPYEPKVCILLKKFCIAPNIWFLVLSFLPAMCFAIAYKSMVIIIRVALMSFFGVKSKKQE